MPTITAKLNLRVGDVLRVQSDRMLTIYRGANLNMVSVEDGYYRVLGFDEHGIDVERVDPTEL